jgi:predicted ATP-grasp superfamily ATP-dependent carboligase
MFQEIIPGPPTSSFQLEEVYNKNSSPIGLFARQRLRIWPLGFGNTTLCVSIPLTEFSHELRELNSFIKRINHTGLMSAEYKKDDRDGKLKILEINARIWLHFWLSTTCGFDILTASYLDAIGEKTRYFPEYAVGIKSLYLANDIKASLQMFKHGNLKLSDWGSSLRGKKQIALFDKADLNPFLIAYSNLAISPFRAPLNFIQKELMKSK